METTRKSWGHRKPREARPAAFMCFRGMAAAPCTEDPASTSQPVPSCPIEGTHP